jgi:hypothetical protein
LSRTLFNVKVKIVKQGGTSYVAEEAIGPFNNLLDTMFSDVKVEFNQKQVSDSRNMYHYRANLGDLFNLYNTSKDTHQTASFWFQNDPGMLDSPNNSAFLKRKNFSDGGKVIDMAGK